MTPEDILTDFNNTQNQFAPIDHQPTSDMQRYYETTTSIPEFINKLEDAQKKAQRANVPIADSTNAPQNRLAQDGIARPKFNSTHRKKFNGNRNTNKFNVNKDNERPPTYKSE